MSGYKQKYIVDGSDFTIAGEASRSLKKILTQLGIDPQICRKATIAMYGDASGDGKISAADYANIKRNINRAITYDLKQNLVADASDDGKISAADYAAVKRFINRAITEFAAQTNKQ